MFSFIRKIFMYAYEHMEMSTREEVSSRYIIDVIKVVYDGVVKWTRKDGDQIELTSITIDLDQGPAVKSLLHCL